MKKKFRFPKQTRTVIVPSLAPLGLDEVARQKIEEVVARYSALPKNASACFEYRYPPGICEVHIYKTK